MAADVKNKGKFKGCILSYREERSKLKRKINIATYNIYRGYDKRGCGNDISEKSRSIFGGQFEMIFKKGIKVTKDTIKGKDIARRM